MNNSRLWKKLLAIIGFLRFTTPLLIFNYTWVAVVLSLGLDWVDSWFAFKAGVTWDFYSRYDKFLDFWWYIFILLFSINLEILPIISILFFYRSIGQFLMLLTRKEKYFFWFPNILERFFLVYLVSILLLGQMKFGVGAQLLMLLLATAITLPLEYFLHVKGYYYGRGKWAKSVKDVDREMMGTFGRIRHFFK